MPASIISVNSSGREADKAYVIRVSAAGSLNIGSSFPIYFRDQGFKRVRDQMDFSFTGSLDHLAT